MRFLKAEWRLAGFGGGELVRSTGNITDPQRPHELEARQPAEIFGVPFPQLWILGFLTYDGIPHDGVAEVIHHCRDGEDAAQPLIETLLGRWLLCLRVS